MTNRTEKELREEFQAFADNIVWQNDDGSEKYIGVGNMADWWISKLTEEVARVRNDFANNIVEAFGDLLPVSGVTAMNPQLLRKDIEKIYGEHIIEETEARVSKLEQIRCDEVVARVREEILEEITKFAAIDRYEGKRYFSIPEEVLKNLSKQ